MASAIVFLLPENPEAEAHHTDWWLVEDGQVVDRGVGTEWVEMAGPRKRVALAPAASVRVEFSERPEALSERQAASAARLTLLDKSLGDPDSLHAVSSPAGDRIATAVVANALMLGWLDWARGAGADPHHVIPVAALLPVTEDWTEARFGSQRVVGRSGIVLPHEPAVVEQLVEPAAPVELPVEQSNAAIARAAGQPPIDLRTGKMRLRKRVLQIERGRIRELTIIAAAIPLLAILYSLIVIAKLNAATDRLDE